MVRECPPELRRVLADTRIFLSQAKAGRRQRRTDRPDGDPVRETFERYRAGDLPEWHPFAVWHRHVFSER